jgi:hypothetical protein
VILRPRFDVVPEKPLPSRIKIDPELQNKNEEKLPYDNEEIKRALVLACAGFINNLLSIFRAIKLTIKSFLYHIRMVVIIVISLRLFESKRFI